MTDKKLSMKIVSPAGIYFAGDVLHATFPGVLGEFAVFPGHAPIISALKNGRVKYVPVDEEQPLSVEIESGFVEVSDDVMTVCVEAKLDDDDTKTNG